MHLVLKLLFCACVVAPAFALRRPVRPTLAALGAAAVLLFLVARSPVDPLGYALQQVDGALQGGRCGTGLRPSR